MKWRQARFDTASPQKKVFETRATWCDHPKSLTSWRNSSCTTPVRTHKRRVVLSLGCSARSTASHSWRREQPLKKQTLVRQVCRGNPVGTCHLSSSDVFRSNVAGKRERRCSCVLLASPRLPGGHATTGKASPIPGKVRGTDPTLQTVAWFEQTLLCSPSACLSSPASRPTLPVRDDIVQIQHRRPNSTNIVDFASEGKVWAPNTGIGCIMVSPCFFWENHKHDNSTNDSATCDEHHEK